MHVIVGAVVRGTDLAAGQRAESWARQVVAMLLALGAVAGHPQPETVEVRRIYERHEQGSLL